MKKKVIICGFGFMGQTHAANIFNSDKLTLAGVVDSTPKDQIKPVSGNIDTGSFDWSQLDTVPFFTTVSEAISKCEFDAVVISSPTPFHASLAVECINNGKHVFLEKPLCSTLSEAKSISDALDGKDLVFHVGHCLRFFPEYSYLKTVCADGRYGKLKHLELLRRTGVPTWGAWKEKDTSLGSVSGPVFDLNIHDVDFALHLLGEPEKVTAQKTSYADKIFETDWSYAGDISVKISGGFAPQSAYPFRAGYTAVFEKATLEFNTMAATSLILSTDEKSEAVNLEPADGYQLEMESFARALHGEETAYCSLSEAAQAIEYSLKLMDELK